MRMPRLFHFYQVSLYNACMTAPSSMTIRQAAAAFTDGVALSRSPNTALTYRKGMAAYLTLLDQAGLSPSTRPVIELEEDSVAWFADALKEHTPATERLYLTIVTRFFEFLVAENLAPINLPRVRLLLRQRSRRPGQRLPQFPREAIETILNRAAELAVLPYQDEEEHLRNLRDRAFLITLGDTGLRVHEACNLRRGDMDWHEGRAIVIGKGNRQDVVRFSRRAVTALQDYLRARAALDGKSGRSLAALPLFARHDPGAGDKVKPITPTTGRNIVTQRVAQLLGNGEEAQQITPHSFRHYFVTSVLRGSGNLKLAQELARHRSIAVTQRYAHLSNDELDEGYNKVFES